MHRFIVKTDLSRADCTITDPDLLHQWMNVLRLNAGDRVMICNGQSEEVDAVIQSLKDTKALLRLEPPRAVTAEPKRDVTLYCSVLKRENFEWVVQKATEVGVKTIIPIIATRTVKMGLKIDRLKMIIKEAAEQSGRGCLPHITEPMHFASALNQAKGIQLFFHTHGHEHPQMNERTKQSTNEPRGIWIGPEGGWTEEEIAQALDADMAIRSLGPLTLRAETAAIVGSYLAVTENLTQ